MDGGFADVVIRDCVFVRNEARTAYGFGGAIVKVDGRLALVNSVIAGNQGRLSGGVIIGGSERADVVEFCTFYGNEARDPGASSLYVLADGEVNIVNSIVWDDEHSEFSRIGSENGGSLSVTSSIIRGGYDGDDILDVDPRFVDSAQLDLHLRADSPAIGIARGATESVVREDFEGHTRERDFADLGADEALVEYTCRFGGSSESGSTVIRVNGASGDRERIVEVRIGDRLEVTVDTPEPDGAPAPFAIYVWPEEPDVTSVKVQPRDVGTTCFPLPFNPGGDELPLAIFNNLGHEERLGEATRESSAAPTVLFDEVVSPLAPSRFTVQGVIYDSSAESHVRTTNALVFHRID